MGIYQDKTFNLGDSISSDDMSQLHANDRANFDRLYEQPRGVVYFKKGFNIYDSSKDIVATDTAASHDTTGTATLAAIRLHTANVKVEPSRRYYIEVQTSLIKGTLDNNIPALKIAVNGSPKTSQFTHIPKISTSTGNGRFTSCRVWLIYDTADAAVFTSDTMVVDAFIQQKFITSPVSSGSIVYAFAQNGSGLENFWIKVEDWGTTIPSETLL